MRDTFRLFCTSCWIAVASVCFHACLISVIYTLPRSCTRLVGGSSPVICESMHLSIALYPLSPISGIKLVGTEYRNHPKLVIFSMDAPFTIIITLSQVNSILSTSNLRQMYHCAGGWCLGSEGPAAVAV